MTEVGLDAAVLDSYWLDTMAGHVSSIQPESTEVVEDIRSTSDQFKLDIVEAVTSLSDDQVWSYKMILNILNVNKLFFGTLIVKDLEDFRPCIVKFGLNILRISLF